MIVGGHPHDGEGAYYAIGHRLRKRDPSRQLQSSNMSTKLYSQRLTDSTGSADRGSFVPLSRRRFPLSSSKFLGSSHGEAMKISRPQSVAVASSRPQSVCSRPPSMFGQPSPIVEHSPPPSPPDALAESPPPTECPAAPAAASPSVALPPLPSSESSDGNIGRTITMSRVPMANEAGLPPMPPRFSVQSDATSAAGAAAEGGTAPKRKGRMVQFGTIVSEGSAKWSESGRTEASNLLARNLQGRETTRSLGPLAAFRDNAGWAEWTSTGKSMSHDSDVARPPAHTLYEVLFDKKSHPPPLVELYCLNPSAASRQALRRPSTLTRLRRQAVAFAALKRREVERQANLERTAPRPYKDNVLLQLHGVRRMKVYVQRQWLLQFPDGRVGLFVKQGQQPDEPPMFLPVLRVLRERQAGWMNFRMTKDKEGKDEPHAALGGLGGRVVGRLNSGFMLAAEYELARTDGRILLSEDIVPEPLALHDEIGRVKRAARRQKLYPTAELHALATRLPRSYPAVGMRVYNPSKAQWKLQVVWVVLLITCGFLVILFFSCLAEYWEHILDNGVDVFVNAYLIDTLLIQAFACEFRELLNILLFNVCFRELVMLLCCLRCASPAEKHRLGLTAEGTAKLTELENARLAREGNARSVAHQLSRMGTLTEASGVDDPGDPPPKPRLLGNSAEALLFTELRKANAQHSAATIRLRAAKRMWRRTLPLFADAEAEEKRVLATAIEQTEWRERRAALLWQHVRSIVKDASKVPEEASVRVELASMLTALTSPLLSPPAPLGTVSVPVDPSERPLAKIPTGLPPIRVSAASVKLRVKRTRLKTLPPGLPPVRSPPSLPPPTLPASPPGAVPCAAPRAGANHGPRALRGRLAIERVPSVSATEEGSGLRSHRKRIEPPRGVSPMRAQPDCAMPQSAHARPMERAAPPTPPPSPPPGADGGALRATPRRLKLGESLTQCLGRSKCSTARSSGGSSSGSSIQILQSSGGGSVLSARHSERQSSRDDSRRSEICGNPLSSRRTSSGSSSESLGLEFRFVPGRAGVTSGYLLPCGRELIIHFEEAPDLETEDADRFHGLQLLAIWEEMVEAQEQATFWSTQSKKRSTRGSACKSAAPNARLRGAVRANRLVAMLQLNAQQQQPEVRPAPVQAAAPELTFAGASGEVLEIADI